MTAANFLLSSSFDSIICRSLVNARIIEILTSTARSLDSALDELDRYGETALWEVFLVRHVEQISSEAHEIQLNHASSLRF